MSVPFRCTETKRNAATYRKAARMVERAEMYAPNSYCCNAIFLAATDADREWGDRDGHPLVERFHDVYKPAGYDPQFGYFEDEKDARVIALCLLASMEEAGDAS